MKRKSMCEAQRRRILEENNYRCAYCGDQANAVDHIIPYAYTPENKDKNLVAACSICNSIAGDQVFDNFIAKQSYILEERQRKKWQRRIARQIEIPILVEPNWETPTVRVEVKQRKRKVEYPFRQFKRPSEPLPVIKYLRPKRTFANAPVAEPKPKQPTVNIAKILADLMVRLYDDKENCMHEIYTFYAITGCK